MSCCGHFCQFKAISYHLVLAISLGIEMIVFSVSCLFMEGMSEGQQPEMRHGVLQVYFSHDLHLPAYPWIKENADCFSLLVSLLIAVTDCKAPPFLLTDQCPKHAHC